MKIIAAPASYKGSLSSIDAARCIADAARGVFPTAEVIEFPLSDGGEGFVDVLLCSGGTPFEEEVDGPLPEQKVKARWGILADGKTGVVEMAAAAGLSLVLTHRRDPKITSTVGVGQLINRALDNGVKRIVLGIGGSATNDAGAGMAQALGVRMLKKDGTEIARGGAALLELHQIDLSWLDRRIRNTEFIVASDVTNTLCGPSGASAIYGPQKGATPEDVTILDAALLHFGELVKRDIGVDIIEMPGSGASGGLGGGCIAFLGAKLQSGVDFVLDENKFAEKLEGTSLIFTGEGTIDEQTKFGKAITGISKRAAAKAVPVVAIGGGIQGDRTQLQQGLGLSMLISLRDAKPQSSAQLSVQEAMERAAELLKEKVTDVLRERTDVRV